MAGQKHPDTMLFMDDGYIQVINGDDLYFVLWALYRIMFAGRLYQKDFSEMIREDRPTLDEPARKLLCDGADFGLLRALVDGGWFSSMREDPPEDSDEGIGFTNYLSKSSVENGYRWLDDFVRGIATVFDRAVHVKTTVRFFNVLSPLETILDHSRETGGMITLEIRG